jgi:hypothetical protein
MKDHPLIKAVVIDPFQCEIFPVQLRKDCASDVAELIDCEMIETVDLGIIIHGTQHVAWVDEEGLLRTPYVWPKWAMQGVNNDLGIPGYGLITGMDENGSMVNSLVSMASIAQALAFEHWRARIDADSVIPRMMRLYKIAI